MESNSERNTSWRNRSSWRGSLVGALTALALLVPIAAFTVGVGDRRALGSDLVNTATVHSVVDGDTFDIVVGGQTERVRLLGIDTPETVSRSTPKQCFGQEASDALKGLLVPGQKVSIFADTERRDRFGRLLLFVFTEDGLSVNQWMLESGFADVLFIEPNNALNAEMTGARNRARAANLGLWGNCDGPDQPLD